MSVDEDTELRDLVAQTLESNGVLGKIRAQLRASVFLALEEQESVQNKTPLLNKDLQRYLETKDGQIVTGLVREFLQHFNLQFTLAVFDPETGAADVCTSTRAQLAKDLNIVESSEGGNQPLLSEVIKRAGGEKATRKTSSSTEIPKSGADKGSRKSDSSGSKIPPATAPKPTGPKKEDSFGSDDPFFDDPVPTGEKSHMIGSDQTSTTSSNKGSNASSRKSQIPRSVMTNSDKSKNKRGSGGGTGSLDTPGDGKPAASSSLSGTGLSSLAGLPALGATGSGRATSTPTRELDRDIQAIDKKIADLGIDIPDEDDYIEDFTSNATTPVTKTPRSGRSLSSSHGIKSFEDDIEEEIEEDISEADDLLKSDNSGLDDLTTDRTVSPTDQSAAFDYIEDVISP